MGKTLLLVGGSHADIPVIEAAKRMGCRVYTSGNRPDDRGHACSDAYFPADYSDPEAVFSLAKKLRVDAVCASANDFSALSAAYAAERLGLPGHDSTETTAIVHHKDRFRDFAQRLGLRVPKAVGFSKEDGAEGKLPSPSPECPWIVKPVDLSGGKGMRKVSSEEELRYALEDALGVSKAGRAVAEEFIEGTNHGYSAFLKEGKIVFAFMDDEQYFVNPYLVSGASTSLSYTEGLGKMLDGELEKMAAALDLKDGLLHTQFILREGEPFILEVCRRTPGDLYVKLVEYATGFDMSEAIVRTVLGEPVVPSVPRKLSWVMRHCVMAERRGRIRTVEYGALEERIFDRMALYRPGDEVSDIATYKAEIDFIDFGTRSTLAQYRDRVPESIRIGWME